ncbi:MAG: outer membrane protein assembly factor BamD [Gammaproteobacteria bacterium]|nr:outer membrane protein assembly factor BamD [Gammaproteobacteria bacterium]
MYKLKSLFIVAIALLLTLQLVACATTGEESFEDTDKTAAALYEEAKSALAQEDYETTIQKLESLEARFPFGKFAQQAQLDMAFAYYKFEEPESAIASANRFIKLYPRHPHADYAYYLKGLVKFSQGQSMFDGLASQDPAQRDPEAASRSFQYFSELVKRFPKSKYAKDATERMTYLRNNLARHELYAAQHYIKREAYLAAANRAKFIIENFQMTPSTPDALLVMIEAYKGLRLVDLAADTQRVYDLNFSKNKKSPG